MQLSLFSRLTIGYLAIFAIVAAASAYAIVELTDFGHQAESILRIDTRVLDHEKFLTDLLLAQSRAEQKFVISRDEAWYLQFVRLKIDFEARAESAAAVADGLAKPILLRIRDNYRRYVDLVDSEARRVRTRKEYPQARFKQDKDTLRRCHVGRTGSLAHKSATDDLRQGQRFSRGRGARARCFVVDHRWLSVGDRPDVAVDHQEHYPAPRCAQSKNPGNCPRQFR